MLEEANYPIPNLDPFERDIFSEANAPGTAANILPIQSFPIDYQVTRYLPPPPDANPQYDWVLEPNPSQQLTYSPLYSAPETDILTGLPERRRASTTSEEPEELTADNFFNSGYFTAGETGEISIDFVYDGGWYRPEVGIFSTEEIPYDPLNNYSAYIKEAANRALSNSSFGHVVISDTEEGAYIKGGNNYGQYQGIKTFNLNPGEKFGLVLSPNGKIEDLLNYPNIPGNKRPLFSLATDNPDDNFWLGQIAEFSSGSGLFVIEDLSVNGTGGDRDYNDIVLNVSGASATVPSLDEVINPGLSWPDNNLGNKFNEYINFSDLTWDNGVFKASDSGELNISYLFDGGGNQGDLALVNLEGLNAKSHSDFVKQAAERALSNSELGYVVIQDKEEGALFDKPLGEKSRNSGEYLGDKTYSVNPGEEYGFMLVPNGTVEEVFERPNIGWSKRPVFSMSTEAEINTFLPGQFVDLTGEGQVFVFEDVRADRPNFDGDYNDFVFSVSGLEGSSASVEEYINPEKDWRTGNNGIEFLEIVDELVNGSLEPPTITVELANDTGEDDTDKITTDPSLTGEVIDDGEVVSFSLSLTGESDSFVEVTPQLESDGSFALSGSVLEEVLGETLPEGVNTIYLRATDEDGLESSVVEFEFTLESEESEDELGPEIESMAGIYGLDAYPDAISLPPGEKRQLSVKIDEWIDSPELTTDIGDISYAVGDEELLEVSPSGVITAEAEGETTITVKYGSAEVTIPVLVDVPESDSTLVDESGGVVETLDGSVVMVPPGALTQETTVELTPLGREDLLLSLPESLEFVGAFELELGDTPLEQPVQLAIPAPSGLEAGTGVLFLRKGRMPDATGTWTDTWLIEEVGGVGTDGMLRTASPPYAGLQGSGEFVMVEIPAGLMPEVSTEIMRQASFVGSPPPPPPVVTPAVPPAVAAEQIRQIITAFGSSPYAPIQQSASAFGWFEILKQSIQIALPPVGQFLNLGARAGLIGVIGASYGQFLLKSLVAAYVATLEKTSLEIIGIPEVGAPVGTTTDVFLNENGLPSYSVELPAPVIGEADPLLAPVVRQAELEFIEENKPVVSLRGSNFLNDFEGEVGSEFDDLIGKFYVGDAVYEAEVLPDKSRELEENEFEVVIEIPSSVPLGEADIVLSRRQEKRVGPEENDVEEVELDSEEKLRLLPTCEELVLVSQRSADAISVVDMLHPMSAIEENEDTSSADLLRANISVGTAGVTDRPGELAATSNGTRAYVPLEFSGQVAVVDLMALRQVDTDAQTPEVEPIPLPDGATPVAMVIDSNDEYAYVASKNDGKIYVLDVNPESDSYHEVVKTIGLELNNDSAELRQMAINADGRRLFVTASYGQIYVVNIDPGDRPKEGESNLSDWWEQIGAFATARGAMGLSATSDPLKMAFTNGSSFSDGSGFGVLKITNDYPLEFDASANYLNLSLDSFRDYFDVDEGVAVAVMKDGEYAFVAGRDTRGNAGTSFYPDKREGGNIGIIKDPLGDNPQLVAATRPIPGSLTNNVTLTGDDKYLLGSYPTLSGGGAVYAFDVEEIIETIETLEARASGEDGEELETYWLDSFNRGEGSVAFDEDSKRSATLGDLGILPIDDLNPEISVAADYEIIGGNWSNQWVFGVPEGTSRAPIGIGGNPFGMTSVSVRDSVELVSPGERAIADSLTPTFEWEFHIEGEEDTEDDCLIEVNPDEVEGVNLYASVFPEGEGLLPIDRWEGLPEQEGVNDYNPNRVLTARWQDGMWTWNGGSLEAPASNESPLPEQFSLPEELQLTGGQTYHWAVEVVTENGEEMVTGQFNTPLGEMDGTGGSNAFSSVTVLTWGPEEDFEPEGDFQGDVSIKNQIDLIARKIEEAEGLVMQYDPSSQSLKPVTYNPSQFVRDWDETAEEPSAYYGKPLVLLADWMAEGDATLFFNSGFSEAGADALYASLVKLDLDLGGDIGNNGSLYDVSGNLNRTQGAVFNSPLHFIGFGEGAVVNTEIVQRLGTFLPDAGGIEGDARELQVTTIDAHQYDENGDDYLPLPSIETWENVTYADNYYQTKEFNYKAIATADLNRNLSDFANFEQDAHQKALNWYAGTSNLNESEEIIRRLGDLPDINKPESTWYTPEHTFEHGSENAPWEGIGTGWFYSVLGGGDDLRPYYLDGDKYSKDEIQVEDYLADKRVSVKEDNTPIAAMRGDYAVPTLFNGNFDAVFDRITYQTIPGWSSNKQKALEDVTGIPGATSYSEGIPNYALKLGGENLTATHDLFAIPDWGNLRFDLYAPNATGALNVKLETAEGDMEQVTIDLQEANFTINNSNWNNLQEIKQIYSDSKNQLGFAKRGFETFQLNLQLDDSKLLKFRGQPANLTFSLEGTGSVYIDNVFFKSDYLKFRNPTEARWDPGSSTYQNNLLLEKPQYALSYNAETKHANWVGWKVDSSWIRRPLPGESAAILSKTPEFIADEDLPNGWLKYDGDIFTGLGMDRGHLSPNRDRRRHPKDQLATYLTTNFIAQSMDNNRIFVRGNEDPSDASAWFNIEEQIAQRALEGEELYIFAGAFGNNWNAKAKTRVPELLDQVNERGEFVNRGLTVPSNLSASNRQIHIPTGTWKVIIPKNSISPTQGPVAYLTPNRAEPNWSEQPPEGYPHPLNQFLGNRNNITSSEQWRNPETWRMTLPELQNILNTRANLPNFEFFELDDDIDF